MNSENPRKTNDSLSNVLQSWRVESPLPPAFERGVWQRIDQARPAAHRPLRETVSSWITNILPRPALAASYIAVLLAVGVTAGWGQARQDKERLRDELSQKYVQVLDPYLAPGH